LDLLAVPCLSPVGLLTRAGGPAVIACTGLQYWEATAVNLALTNLPVSSGPATSPPRSLIKSDLTVFEQSILRFDSAISVRNSRIEFKVEHSLCDYASRNALPSVVSSNSRRSGHVMAFSKDGQTRKRISALWFTRHCSQRPACRFVHTDDSQSAQQSRGESSMMT
jgi:hypothetical protein